MVRDRINSDFITDIKKSSLQSFGFTNSPMGTAPRHKKSLNLSSKCEEFVFQVPMDVRNQKQQLAPPPGIFATNDQKFPNNNQDTISSSEREVAPKIEVPSIFVSDEVLGKALPDSNLSLRKKSDEQGEREEEMYEKMLNYLEM